MSAPLRVSSAGRRRTGSRYLRPMDQAPEQRAESCSICGEPPPYALVFRPPGGPRAMVRCPACGVVFQDPQPSDAVLRTSYYHDPQFAHALASELRELTLARARQKLALLRRAGLAPPSGARALDVGCSSGAWLEVAADAGLRATGVEIGEPVVRQARAGGLDVRYGTLESCLPSLRHERFDLITFWDVLEHTRDPRRELELATALLAPNGIVAATFPNVDGLYPQVTYRLLARLAGAWEYPELPLHLYDFGPLSATRLFEAAGCAVLTLHTFPVPFSFYRSTSLQRSRLGGGSRGVLLRLAFEALHLCVYPLARALGRENSLFVAGRRADGV